MCDVGITAADDKKQSFALRRKFIVLLYDFMLDTDKYMSMHYSALCLRL